MILGNVVTADGGQTVDIKIEGDKIDTISLLAINADDQLSLYFEDSIIFPGLINSHDHLDFNLFPQLGNQIYNNYTEWGANIHRGFKKEIAAVLNVPRHLRILWGIYKNLLCGVTTVVNHGERLNIDNALLNIFEEKQDLHSASFEKLWKLKLNNPLKRKLPVVIHTGEGSDKLASREIDELISWNKFGRPLVGIHAVAMSKQQAPYFKALVWCPQSNFYLLNKTADIHKLKPFADILFGTDSTLTGSWNIWDHINMARNTGMLSDQELYQSLNKTAAKTWNMNTGEVIAGKYADMVIAKASSGNDYNDAFFATRPAHIQMVIHRGNIRLFDQALFVTLAGSLKGKSFSLIKLDGAYKYVEGNIGELMTSIQSYLPGVVFPVTFIQHQII
ncbi:amidohydrolase family protein [Mucilaginibacter ginsenosidivorax]|uniref:Amidohydrolase family protein n=1 Tax=Mucilaginibacter ginsenosidivorax TaxID=862126 RepID=A0A5B8W8L7_9SPHI|nr:amidohydrolase family protein [Mucilaginibacter ginsenosidivorax]QEC80051.1 amidohydrolase family protein [Mucilaginibacter ginsenosidivorax]